MSSDWQLAQQIASQLADDDELERQRQRQAQIDAYISLPDISETLTAISVMKSSLDK